MDQIAGIIRDAAKCLCGCAYEQAAYISGLEENLQSLTTKWEDLQSMKQDLQRKVEEAENTADMERTQEVSTWLRRIEGIQGAIEDIQVQGAQEIQKKCLSNCCPKNCVSSYKLGKNIVKMLKNADELATTGKRFNKEVEIAHKLAPKPMEMPTDEIVGLDLMLEKVWNSIEADDIHVIGLYGMGGTGKTTLLKRINNKFRERKPNFDVVMWVVVSKENKLDKIMDDIRTKVGIADDIWNHCISQDDKVAKIYQRLKQKKFVLFLDDIWERIDLKMVGVPHPKETNFQSKVLFTTRFEDVCAKMRAQKIFKVECLSKKEAFELFCMKVGEETLNSHHDIPKLAKEMAAECKGLPLALNVVGSAMAGVKSVQAWEHSKNDLKSSPWIASNLEKNVFSILKFSYDRLSNETHKICFLFCALLPEDYEIEVEDLIDKWIGEGFLGKDWTKSVYDMYDHGESVIEKLRLSCLLESVEDGLLLQRKVKMHDVIRDMALWIARDEDKNKYKILVQGEALATSRDNDDKKWKIVERISIVESGDDWHVPKAACPNLIAVTFAADAHRKIRGLSNIQYMSKLKVLDLSYSDYEIVLEVPLEIGGLILLEYLSLNGIMSVLKFPVELKNLKKLKILSLTNYSDDDLAIILSEVISSLEQLRVFRFHSNENRSGEEEKALLENLESLQNLEELSIEIKTRNGLEKLLQSTKLQSCIRHLHLILQKKKILIDMQLLLESMSKMKHLQFLAFFYLSSNIVEDSSIFYTCRLSKLRTLIIIECPSIIHLTWVKYAPLLQDLQINDCESMEEVIKEGTKDDKDRENVDNTFSSLVKLELLFLPKLKSIHKTALPFPSLRFIKVLKCPNMNKLPFNSNSAKDNFIEGSQEWWDNLEWEDQAIKDKFQTKFQAW